MYTLDLESLDDVSSKEKLYRALIAVRISMGILMKLNIYNFLCDGFEIKTMIENVATFLPHRM